MMVDGIAGFWLLIILLWIRLAVHQSECVLWSKSYRDITFTHRVGCVTFSGLTQLSVVFNGLRYNASLASHPHAYTKSHYITHVDIQAFSF